MMPDMNGALWATSLADRIVPSMSTRFGIAWGRSCAKVALGSPIRQPTSKLVAIPTLEIDPGTVVWRFLRNRNVMGMALLH